MEPNTGEENFNKGVVGERLVNQLAFNTYLKYWCYPNPIDLYGDKKEICDLLICFHDTCIIISVKNYTFTVEGEEYNYERMKIILSRFKKRVIEKSTNQLYGAERKLFNSDRDIFIKHPDRELEKFEKNKYKHIYRITINVGEQFEIYQLSDSQEKKGFISILDKDTFEALVQELDTIKDLITYLDSREKLLLVERPAIWSGSEKDILSMYLRNARSFPDEYYGTGEQFMIFQLDGAWDIYNEHKSVGEKREANKVSYLIDRMVENDVLKIKPYGEVLAKELMALNRLERRALAINLFGIVEQCKKTDVNMFGRRFVEINSIGYLLIHFPAYGESDFVDFVIGCACQIYSYKFNHSIIIALATNTNIEYFKYQMFYAPNVYEQEYVDYLDKMIIDFGWLSNLVRIEYSEKEYPDEPDTTYNPG